MKNVIMKTQSKKKLAGTIAVIFSLGLVMEASALTSSDSARGLATLKVYQRIRITKVRDLRFGDVLQGETSTLPVSATDNANSAKFDVIGVPSTLVSVGLDKTSIDVIKLDGSGNPVASPTNDQKVTIGSVISSGDANTDSTGKLSVYVGGTRPAIPSSQEAGSYAGEFTVTVSQSN